MPGKRLTINDIARLAGVSSATVSRVLNHKPDVDPITRERILHIVEEQEFVRSAAAAGLAGGRSHLIGMAVRSYTWRFMPEIMHGMADIIDQTAYELVLYRLNDRFLQYGRSHAINSLLSTNLTDGLLAIFPGHTSVRLASLSRQGFPLVVIDDEYLLTETPWTSTPIPWITSDSRTGAYEAVKHLIEHGHRRIAHIQGPMTFLCARERHAGYSQALEEAGLALDPTLVLEGDFNPGSGRTATHTLLSLPAEQRPTAIFAASDLMAYGVIAAASECGMRIPTDIALVGFDDLTEMTEDIVQLSQLHSSLTTIRQPFYEMGRYATELLLSYLETPYAADRPDRWLSPLAAVSSYASIYEELGGVIRLQLPVKLIVRASCGCVPSLPDVDIAPLAV